MRAIALFALTGCTQIFGLAEPVERAPQDAAGSDAAMLIDARGSDATSPAACSDPTLRACFDFEGSVVDLSAAGNVVTTIANVAFSAAGGPDGMYAQIGVSSAMTLAASTTFNTPTYTVAAWVRLDSLPAGGGRFGVFDAEARYGIFILSTGSMVTRTITSPANSVGVGTWTHLAVTDTGTMITFYVDGVALSTNAINQAVATNNMPAEIGGNIPSGDRLEGGIDALRVYSRALSPAEVAQLFAN